MTEVISQQIHVLELLYDVSVGEHVASRTLWLPEDVQTGQVGSFLTFHYGEPSDMTWSESPDRPGERLDVGWVFDVPPGVPVPGDRDLFELHAIPMVEQDDDDAEPLFAILDRARRAGTIPWQDLGQLAGSELWEPGAEGWAQVSSFAATAGDHVTAQAALDEALRLLPPRTPDEHGRACDRRAAILLDRQDPAAAVALIAPVIETYDQELDPDVLASLERSLAAALHDLGRHDEALARLLNHRLEAERTEDAHDLALIDLEIALSLTALGQHQAARVRLEHAAAVFDGAEDHDNLATARLNLGSILNALGEADRAVDVLDLAINWFASTGERRQELDARFNQANVLAQMGEIVEAADFWTAAVDAYDEMSLPLQSADAMDSLASALHEMGRHNEALAWHEQAAEVYAQHAPDSPDAVTCALATAHTLDHLGRWDEAEERALQALTVAKDKDWDGDVAHALGTLALILANGGDPAGSLERLEELRTLIQKTGVHVDPGWLDLLTATTLRSADRPDEALAVAERAVDRTTRYPLLLVEALLELARVHDALLDRTEAEARRAEAISILDRLNLSARIAAVHTEDVAPKPLDEA